MFLHLSVSYSVHRVVCVAWGVYGGSGMECGSHAWQEVCMVGCVL